MCESVRKIKLSFNDVTESNYYNISNYPPPNKKTLKFIHIVQKQCSLFKQVLGALYLSCLPANFPKSLCGILQLFTFNENCNLFCTTNRDYICKMYTVKVVTRHNVTHCGYKPICCSKYLF